MPYLLRSDGAGATLRMSPSWAVLAISRPSRVKMLARV